MGEDSLERNSPADFDRLFTRCVQFYYSGQLGQLRSGLELSSDGVRRARAVGDRASLRKLLTTHAILQSDLHNLPQAFEAFSEALDLSNETQEPLHLFIHWQNISAALAYAELPHLAASAARAALEYATKISCSRLRQIARGVGFSNLAYACLFTKAYGLGLRSSKLATELLDVRGNADESQYNIDLANLVLALTVHTRLLLRVNMLDEAVNSLERAEALASDATSPKRIHLVVEMSRSLLETYCGNFDRGVSRLREFVLCQASPVLVADALRDLVEAHVAANRPQLAAEHLCQLGKHMQQVRSEVALFHHQHHMGWLASIAEVDSQTTVQAADKLSRCRNETRSSSQGSSVLEDLCAAAELHDDASGKHSYRVAELARLLALRVGIEKDESARIAFAAKLHDVGKIGIPPAVLRKPGPLDLGETEIVRSHAAAGADLLAAARIDDLATAVAVARHHHEWWSGQGYPDGLSGESIPIAARITALCEAFDAMTHDRPYRPRRAVASALDLITENAGRQFDPQLAPTFCKLVRDLQLAHADIDEHLERNAELSGFLRAKERFNEQIARLGL